jgi:hypothetical protein
MTRGTRKFVMKLKGLHLASAVLALQVVSCPAAVLYVNLNNPSPVSPYASWSTAATNIQNAVDAANPGDQILVTNGVYQTGGRLTSDGMTNRVAVTKAVSLQSVNGSNVTSIDGGQIMRCVYLTNGAALSGFTLVHGSAGNGGGAWCSSTNVLLSNCLLENNTASSGGGVYSGTLSNCTLSGNTCPATGTSGGGANGSTLYNCTLSANVTGVYLHSGATVGGGASGCLLNNCTLSGNYAYGAGAQGGGAYNSTLTNCSIASNYTDDNGGGGSGGVFANCTFTGNTASGGGGGAVTGGTLYNCVLSNNRAGGDGGGAYYGTTLYNCTISGNSAGYGGGATECSLVNCLLYGNSAGGYGGGAYYGTLINCTVISNTAQLFGGYGGGAYNATLDNCIVYYNNGGSSGPNDYSCTLNYCCTPTATGAANTTNAPLLDATYHLQSGSPCIDTGNNAYVTTATDLGGGPRIINNIVDMGAYEFHTSNFIVIEVQPAGQNELGEQTVLFNVVAVSPLALDYQWLFDGTNIFGATNSSCAIPDVQSNNAGTYSVVISNGSVTVNSSNAVLTVVYPAPNILSQPASLTVISGSNAMFSVSATNNYTISFQWQLDGTNLVNGGRISGATNAVLNISDAQPGDEGNYEVVVLNKYGIATTSSVATLTVLGAPIISTPPSTNVMMSFSYASFAESATGAPPPYYQWQKNGTNLFDGGDISGSATATLTISNSQVQDGGQYGVTVSNSFGVATITNLYLTVVPFALWGNTGSPIPVEATNLLALSAGGDFGWGEFELALRADGTLVAWGSDYSDSTNVPPEATNVVAIAAGDYHGLALLPDGTVLGWGENSYGESTPPASATNVVAVAAGQWHSMVLKQDGTVVAWGNITATPPNATNVVAISAGSDFSLALRQDGTVVGWGENNSGQAAPPANATNVVAIAAGWDHSLALLADGTVIGWGDDGEGATTPPADATNVVAIAAGNSHSLALRQDGTVVAWGYDYFGEIDIPDNLTNVSAISAKEFHSTALVGTGPPSLQVSLIQPSLGSDGFSVSLPSRSGRVYVLQYKNALTDSSWVPLPPVAGTGSLLTLTNSPATDSQRFYRVLRW